MEIEAETLTTFELAPDGRRVRLNGAAADGCPITLSLPSECLSQLAMTLPRMASVALQRQYNDDALRMVYPACGWSIEPGVGNGDSFILTLGTPDGFQVSFAIESTRMPALENDVRNALQMRLRASHKVN